MKIAHFYAYGIIGEPDILFTAFTGQEDPSISAKKVSEFISSNPLAEELVIHINSRGGSVSEGFAIHDLLTASGKRVTTIGEGLVASIATVIFLAGEKRELLENAQLMIHNPWIDPSSIGGLTADEIQQMANDMKNEENRIINFYVSKTGGEVSQIADMMDKETTFSAGQALELKFATEIKTPIKAFAYLNPQTMNNEMKTLGQKVDTILNFLTGKTKKMDIKAEIKVTATDGSEVIISDNNGDGVAEVGDTVTDATGTPMAGATIVLADMTLTTDDMGVILTVEAMQAMNDVEELKAKVLALEASLKEKESEAVAFKAYQVEIDNKLNLIAKNIQSTHKVPQAKQSFSRKVEATDDFTSWKESRKKQN